MLKHTIRRAPTGRTTYTVKLVRSKAIRYFCLECCGWQSNEVKQCPDTHCPLYPYRLGRLDPQFGADDEQASVVDSSDNFDAEDI